MASLVGRGRIGGKVSSIIQYKAGASAEAMRLAKVRPSPATSFLRRRLFAVFQKPAIVDPPHVNMLGGILHLRRRVLARHVPCASFGEVPQFLERCLIAVELRACCADEILELAGVVFLNAFIDPGGI